MTTTPTDVEPAVEPCAAVHQAVLAIDGLGRTFGSRDVVSELTLSLNRGERAALWGPNGSGKTTVLRCIAGTIAPTRGTVLVSGHPAGSVGARRALGASLSQERSFYLRLTGRANLIFFARLRYSSVAEARSRVASLEEELEIGAFAGQRADRCSSGMLQQLGLARALLGEPSLLVLDEPTRSLDAKARDRFWAALDRRPETAVVVATHLDQDVDHCGRLLDFPI